MFEIKNEAEISQIFFYGDIVANESDKWSYDDSCPSEIRDFLQQNSKKDLELRINSGGGNCFGGIAIANMIKSHKGKTVAYVDGLCASIATVIASACDKVHITKNSFFMIHNAWLFAQGNKEDLRETIEVLEKMDNAILESYAKHLKEGVELDTIRDLMKAETWLCGEEILQYFDFILEEDEIVEAYAKVNKDFNYRNVPHLLNKEEEEEKPCEECGKNPCECEVDEEVEKEPIEEEDIEEDDKPQVALKNEEQDKEVEEEEEELEKEPLEDKEEEIKDEVDEEPLEEEVEDKKVCETCLHDPCICEEIKRKQEKEEYHDKAIKELAYMKAQEFMKKYK